MKIERLTTRPSRLIAIGDIHGQLDMLNRLLNVVSPQSTDQFVFLGDYIDRGKNSRGVIDRLIQFQREHPATIFLRGNHEQLLLDTLIEISAKAGFRLRDISPRYRQLGYESDMLVFMRNGGNETLRSYRLNDIADLPKEHIDFIDATRLWWRFEHFLFVHAGVDAGCPLNQQDPYIFLWERLSPPGSDGEIHIVGHTPIAEGKPYLEAGRYNLDTGAAFGKALTACDVLTKQIWQVS